jgi:phage-related protein
MKSIFDGFGSYYSKIGEIGLNLVKGLWNGIKDATGWVLEKIKGFGKSILNGIKNIFGIHSPSTVFKEEVGKNLALGVGEGFADTMADVSADMQSAIPTEFDANISTNMGVASAASHTSTYDMMVSAFKQALTEVKVVMDDREMGGFVTNTIERVVYA